MKWKRNRRAKEQVSATSLTDSMMDMESLNHSICLNSGLEVEKGREVGDEFGVEEMKQLNEASLGSVSFTRYKGRGARSYSSYCKEEIKERS